MIAHIKHKLAQATIGRLSRKRYVSVFTSLVTLDGPAVGTIWWDSQQPKLQPFTVAEVTATEIIYTDGGHDGRKDFLHMVESRRYLLLGVQTEPHTHLQT